MRTFLVLTAGLLLPGCYVYGVSGALTPEAKAERRARIEAANAAAARGEAAPAARSSASYRGTEGFSGAVWGMSPKDVQGLFPAAVPGADGGLTTRTLVDGRPATVGFVFTRGLLAAVEVTFAPQGAVRDEHAAIKQVLVGEYGAPSREVDEVAAAEERVRAVSQPPAPAAGADVAQALPPPDPALVARREALEKKALEGARARAKVDTEWATQESALLLHGENTAVGPQLKLHFLSLTLAPQLQAERERAAGAAQQASPATE